MSYWNARGGAPSGEYEKLQSTEQSLRSRAQSLETERLAVNSLAERINSLIQSYNSLAKNINSNIKVINQNAGKEFDEGIYDPNTDSVDIYQFESNHDLLRVLAHELGHSLGLDHEENSESIMFASNVGKGEALTAEDIAQLKQVCGV